MAAYIFTKLRHVNEKPGQNKNIFYKKKKHEINYKRSILYKTTKIVDK